MKQERGDAEEKNNRDKLDRKGGKTANQRNSKKGKIDRRSREVIVATRVKKLHR